jgi:hypothetical protein
MSGVPPDFCSFSVPRVCLTDTRSRPSAPTARCVGEEPEGPKDRKSGRPLDETDDFLHAADVLSREQADMADTRI